MWYSKHDTSVSDEAAELNKYLTDNDMLGTVAREVASLDSR